MKNERGEEKKGGGRMGQSRRTCAHACTLMHARELREKVRWRGRRGDGRDGGSTTRKEAEGECIRKRNRIVS